MAHIFVGVISRVTNAFKAKTTDAESFLGALQDGIRIQGAPTKLLLDNSGIYCSWRITRYLRDIWTSLWQCESKHQHHNYDKNCYKLVQQMTNWMMNQMNSFLIVSVTNLGKIQPWMIPMMKIMTMHPMISSTSEVLRRMIEKSLLWNPYGRTLKSLFWTKMGSLVWMIMGSLSLSLQRIQYYCIPQYFSPSLMSMENNSVS